MKNKIATVFGGTGFVGRQIVRELASRGVRVKVATRVPERAFFLKPCGDVGQVVPFYCDYTDEESVASAIKGSDFVVNCIGVLYQRGKNSFKRLHSDLPEVIASVCQQEGVSRFVHISALGVNKGSSKYSESKHAGEIGVKANFPQATILRPSIIFGEDDNFFNQFAELSRYIPVLPLIGGGETKFQPVFVGDVADAVMVSLEKDEAAGQIYELGGNEVLSFKDVYERIFKYTGRKRAMISLPFWLMKIEAALLSLLPKPLITPDQVESLKTDNVLSGEHQGLQELGIVPTSLALILPTYLETYRTGGRFGEIKKV